MSPSSKDHTFIFWSWFPFTAPSLPLVPSLPGVPAGPRGDGMPSRCIGVGVLLVTFGVGEVDLLSQLVSIINGLEVNTFKQYDYLVQQL